VIRDEFEGVFKQIVFAIEGNLANYSAFHQVFSVETNATTPNEQNRNDRNRDDQTVPLEERMFSSPKGEYGFLSTSSAHPVEIEGKVWQNVEHYLQVRRREFYASLVY
jgi:hypothetical protein